MLVPWSIERHSTNTFTINYPDVKPGWEAWLLLRSDVHHDNPKCDWKLEKKHLDMAKERNAAVIDNGDLFCAMQGKWDKRSSKDSIRPEHQGGGYLDLLVDTAVEFYEPYAKQFAVLGLGNHETAIHKAHETCLTGHLVRALNKLGSPVMKSGYSGWVRFQFDSPGNNASPILLHHYHGSGGGGPVTRGVIDTSRITNYTPDPDIVLTGHTHDEWTVTIPRQRITDRMRVYRDEQLHIRPPGYKDAWADGAGGFEVERRHGPKATGAAWVRLWYESKKVHFESVRAK
jgi:hypothetical protein